MLMNAVKTNISIVCSVRLVGTKYEAIPFMNVKITIGKTKHILNKQ